VCRNLGGAPGKRRGLPAVGGTGFVAPPGNREFNSWFKNTPAKFSFLDKAKRGPVSSAPFTQRGKGLRRGVIQRGPAAIRGHTKPCRDLHVLARDNPGTRLPTRGLRIKRNPFGPLDSTVEGTQTCRRGPFSFFSTVRREENKTFIGPMAGSIYGSKKLGAGLL